MIQGLLVFLVALCLPVPGQAASRTRRYNRGMPSIRTANTPRLRNSTVVRARCYQGAAKFTLTRGMPRISSRSTAKLANTTRRRCQTTDRTLEGKVKYNLGNVEYRQALQNLQQPQAAMPHLALGDDLLS